MNGTSTTGSPMLAAATAPAEGRRPPAPRPRPLRVLPTTSGTAVAAVAGSQHGTTGLPGLPGLLRRAAPAVGVALVAAFLGWRLVHALRR